ncbi:MAG: hypothetical protein R3A12_15760 [Ignavibacteria bacterium]
MEKIRKQALHCLSIPPLNGNIYFKYDLNNFFNFNLNTFIYADQNRVATGEIATPDMLYLIFIPVK